MSKHFIVSISVLCLAFIFLFPSFGFTQAGEKLVLSTYYPAPFGVYREMQIHGNSNAKIILRYVDDVFDGGLTSGMIISDDAVRHPQIHFQNHAYSGKQSTNSADFAIGQRDNNNFYFVYNDTTGTDGFFSFASKDNTGTIVPETIRVGGIYRCSSY